MNFLADKKIMNSRPMDFQSRVMIRLAALNENPGLDFSILKEWNYAK